MSKLLLVPIYFFTFVPGGARLIYEVTWQKYLSRMLGSDSVATTVILATFLRRTLSRLLPMREADYEGDEPL